MQTWNRRAESVARTWVGTLLTASAILGSVAPFCLADDPPPPDLEQPYVASESEDLSGDAVGDLVLADPSGGGDENAPAPGMVLLRSGEDDTVILKIKGQLEGDHFGYSVAIIDDLNLDGWKDLVVGAPSDGTGKAYAFYGPFTDNGPFFVSAANADMVFQTPANAGVESFFGRKVGAVSDLDGDGAQDIRIRTTHTLANGVRQARTYLVSGLTGEPLYVIEGTSPFDPWAAVTGDADADGDVDDVDTDIVTEHLSQSGDVGDLNGDHVVNGVDLGIVLGNQGRHLFKGTGPGGTSIGPGIGNPGNPGQQCLSNPPVGYHCIIDCWGRPVVVPINVERQCDPIAVCPNPGCYVEITPSSPPCSWICLDPRQCVFSQFHFEAKGPFGQTESRLWSTPTPVAVQILSPSLTGPSLDVRFRKLGPAEVDVLKTGCSTCDDEAVFESAWIDSDFDKLPDAIEDALGLSASDWDSDGDGIIDGDEDSDGDGLSNADEITLGFNPADPDTDHDGAPDGQELPGQGGGAGNEVVSPCEAIDGHIGKLWMSVDGAVEVEYDEPGNEMTVCAGHEYRLRFHYDTNTGFLPMTSWEVIRGQAYVQTVGDPNSPRESPLYSVDVDQPPGLGGELPIVFAVHKPIDDYGGQCTDTFRLNVVSVDLDIDSDNTNGYGPPDHSENEEGIEANPALPGKLIIINNADSDGDGIPDFADGFNLDGVAQTDDDASGDNHFIPITVTFPADPRNPQYSVYFDYAGSDPAAVTITDEFDDADDVTAPANPFEASYHAAAGSLRIWKKNEDAARDKRDANQGGDFIRNGQPYSLSSLEIGAAGGTITLFVEAVRPSTSPGDLVITADFEGCAKPVRLTAFGSRLVARDASGTLQPVEHPQLSHPTPVIDATAISLANVRASEDNARLLADVTLEGTITDAVLDMSPYQAGTVTQMGVNLNGQPLIMDGIAVLLTVDVTWDEDEWTAPTPEHPHPYVGTFSQQFQGVEIQPGWNKLELMAANRFDFIGFAEKSFEVTPTPPEDADLEISLTTVSRTDDQTIFANFMITRPTGAPEPFSGSFTRTPSGSYHDSVLNATIVLEPDSSVFDPQHQLLITFSFPDQILSDISVLLNNSASDPFHYGGERVVTEDDRLDWAGHEFALTAESFITASAGGDYNPFFIEWLGPATLTQSLQDIKISSFFLNPDGTPANVERTFDLATIEGHRLLSFSGSDFATPIIGTTTLLEQLAAQGGPKRMGVWNFTKGFGTGLCDTGVSLYDGVATLCKGGWYVAKNYNYFTIQYRLLSGQNVVLEEDQKRISMAWGTVTQIAEVAWKLHQFNQEVTDAVLAGDQEELNELGEQYRAAAEVAQFLVDTALDELQNMDDYEFGKLSGRITGEIVVQAGTLLLSAGAGTVLRDSELMTNIITKLGTLSDSVIPAAMKTKLLALLEPGGFIAKMASTKMCFVAGTLVHTSHGLVPIEQVNPSDLVLSRDPATGEQGFKPVLQTFVTHPEMLYRVEYSTGAAEGSGSSKTGTLVGTGQHPLYVEDAAAFVPLSELRIGDRLRLADGSAAYVTDVHVERGPPVPPQASDGDGSEALTTYNFEVEDWHTYFVGEEGVWVHNAGRAPCERAFALISRIVEDNPGISHWEAFVKALEKTNTPARMATFDQVMPEVVESLMEAMYKEAVLPDGTVDLTKVKSWKEIDDFRESNPLGFRLKGIDLQNHHTAVKEWAKVLLGKLPQYEDIGDAEMAALLDEMPGFVMDGRLHVGPTPDGSAFHQILSLKMASVDVEDSGAILDALEEAYQEWDSDFGPTVWKVARQWLVEKGVQ